MLSGTKNPAVEAVVPEIKVRYNKSTSKKLPSDFKVSSSESVANLLRRMFTRGEIEFKEFFIALLLDTKLSPIGYYKQSVGGKNATVMDSDQLVAVALKANASAMIVCHNHPSGNLTASEADKVMTKKLNQALEGMNIRLLDHIIVTKKGHTSFADKGMLGLSGFTSFDPPMSPPAGGTEGGNLTPNTQHPTPNIPPIEEPEMPTFKAPEGARSAFDIMSANYDTMPFNRTWSELMKDAPKNFQMGIYGLPKNGKTVLSTKFANYLSNFGHVHYNFADQGFNKSTKDILMIAGLEDNPNVSYSDVKTLPELEKVIKNTQFVFVDLIDKYQLTPEQFAAFVKKYPEKSFIRVFATTKDGNFRGDNNWMHDLDQIVRVHDFVAHSTGRYGGGEYVVWKRD